MTSPSIFLTRVGDLRLRLPQPVLPYTGTINATAFGNQCVQQTFPSVVLPSSVPVAAGEYAGTFLGSASVPTSEDCTWLDARLWFTLLVTCMLIDVLCIRFELERDRARERYGGVETSRRGGASCICYR